MSKRFLVTGGAGTLAGDLVDFVLKHAPEIEVVLTDIVPKPINFSFESDNIFFVRGDSTDVNFLKNLFERNSFDGVVHFASSMKSGQEGFHSNILSLIATMEAASSFNSPKIFYPQSFLTRDCSIEISDGSPIANLYSDYAIYKATCEQLLSLYDGDYAVGIISTTVSPRLDVGPIPAFTKRFYKNQNIEISDTMRDYISPEATVSAILNSFHEGISERVLAIGSGNSVHTAEIASQVASILQVRFKLPPLVPPKNGDPDTVKFIPSPHLVRFGWSPVGLTLPDLEHTISCFLSSSMLDRQHHVSD